MSLIIIRNHHEKNVKETEKLFNKLPGNQQPNKAQAGCLTSHCLDRAMRFRLH